MSTPAEVPARRTRWTRQEILAAYAAAWRELVGGEPSRACLALLWAQASLETGRGGDPGCFNWNVGNIMAFDGYDGAFHVLLVAPECFAEGKVPAGWREIPASSTSIACSGKVPAVPAQGSRFRAYGSLAEGCRDKVRVLDRQWPRAIVALAAAQGPADADAFVAGLIGPPRYFTASSSSYAGQLRSLASECLRATPENEWPTRPDTLPSPPLEMPAPAEAVPTRPEPLSRLDTGAATPLRAGEAVHTVPTEDPEL